LLIVVVIALALFWGWGRQSPGDFVAIDLTKGGTLKLNDGTELTLPPEGLSSPVQLKASAVSTDQRRVKGAEGEVEMATAVAQLPPNLSLQSAIYHFELEGATPSEALLNIPSPTKTEAHALDLYTWDGANWRWQACRLDSEAGKFMAHLKTLPIAVALLQKEPETPVITTDVKRHRPPFLVRPKQGVSQFRALYTLRIQTD